MAMRDFLQGRPLGHALHPLFTHFPSALFPTALFFDLLSWVLSETLLVRVALYNVAVGLVVAFGALLTGWADGRGVLAGSLRHQVLTAHWVLEVASLVLFALGLGVRLLALDAERTPLLAVGLSALGFVALLMGSFLGGHLVYRMGMRVSTRAGQEVLLERAMLNLVRRTLGRRKTAAASREEL